MFRCVPYVLDAFPRVLEKFPNFQIRSFFLDVVPCCVESFTCCIDAFPYCYACVFFLIKNLLMFSKAFYVSEAFVSVAYATWPQNKQKASKSTK